MIKKSRVLVGGLVILIVVGEIFLLKMDLNGKHDECNERVLPKIEITLKGTNLEEIDGGSKEIKYGGNDLKVCGREINYDDEVEIKGRGNVTWVQEKKPYRIKFTKKVDLFGMGKARKWYLLANAIDPTHLRNDLSFELADMLGMEYVFKGKFVELYIDEEYRGLYYLTHAVEIDKKAVDLRDPLGLLVELDNIYGVNEDYYKTGNGDLLVIKDVVEEDQADIAMTDFLKKYNELEIAVEEKDFEKIKKLADVESFVKYYLLSEFIVNPDAYWTSFYFYKDGLEDKIHAGPGWDFDLAFANRKWENWMGERFYDPTETMIRKQEISSKEYYDDESIVEEDEASSILSKIIFDLMEISEFREEVSRIFQERLSGRKEEFLNKSLKRVDEIREAAIIDNEKWEKEDFDNAVNEMVDWIRRRFDHLEQEYGNRSLQFFPKLL